MTTPFDERAHAGPEHLDRDYVATCDARTEYSPYAPALESMLVHAGFEIVEVEHDRRRTYSRYVCRTV